MKAWRRLFWGATLTALFASGAASAAESQLWGADGELWSPTSRLPDYSHAGYHEGETPIPDVPAVTNASDFGVVGDGVTDDTAALQAAIAATSGGALLIPAGRYLVTKQLAIQASNVVLRGVGDGPTDTVLYFTKSMADLYGVAPQWSWSGGLVSFSPGAAASSVTTVVGAAARGDTSLTVADASALSVGQVVVMQLVDDGSGSLGAHLHNDQAASGNCSYQVPLKFDWPVRIVSITGNTLTLAQPLRTEVRPEWSAQIYDVPWQSEVGVEHLRIEFLPTAYAGHLNEPGYNGIFFHDGVLNGWVRDVTIVDSDNGLLTDVRVKGLTFRDFRLEGRKGHHGLNIASSSDLLVQDFVIDNDWTHFMTLDHRSNGVVFSRGTGQLSLILDHHRDSPLENLFTEMGPYNFASSGNLCAGPHGGARNTYWNLASPMAPPYLWAVVQTNVIGELNVADSMTTDQQWYENVTATDPKNLYEAQVSARLCSNLNSVCTRGAWDVDTGTCGESPRPDGIPCDDGDPCTEADACSLGVCQGTSICGGEGGGGSSAGTGGGGVGGASSATTTTTASAGEGGGVVSAASAGGSATTPSGDEPSGCGCVVAGSPESGGFFGGVLFGLAALARRRLSRRAHAAT